VNDGACGGCACGGCIVTPVPWVSICTWSEGVASSALALDALALDVDFLGALGLALIVLAAFIDWSSVLTASVKAATCCVSV
jgi:hypothetical protein